MDKYLSKIINQLVEKKMKNYQIVLNNGLYKDIKQYKKNFLKDLINEINEEFINLIANINNLIDIRIQNDLGEGNFLKKKSSSRKNKMSAFIKTRKSVNIKY
tara:strand:- start:1109 stop:1414 length:306 start_codon:yes stop_codon:yes gene_type:complete